MEIVLMQKSDGWYWYFNNEEDVIFGPFEDRKSAVEDAVKHQSCPGGKCDV